MEGLSGTWIGRDSDGTIVFNKCHWKKRWGRCVRGDTVGSKDVVRSGCETVTGPP